MKTRLVEIISALYRTNRNLEFYYDTKVDQLLEVTENSINGKFVLYPDIILENERYIKLPTRAEFSDFRMMEDFAYLIEDDGPRYVIINALRSKYAYDQFYKTIQYYHLDTYWKTYRRKRYRALAIDWCEKHKIYVIGYKSLKLYKFIEALEHTAQGADTFYDTYEGVYLSYLFHDDEYHYIKEHEQKYIRYYQLPDYYTINLENIMKKFSNTLDEDKRNILLSSLNSNRGKEIFVDYTYMLNIHKEYKTYLYNVLKDIAYLWCQENEFKIRE